MEPKLKSASRGCEYTADRISSVDRLSYVHTMGVAITDGAHVVTREQRNVWLEDYEKLCSRSSAQLGGRRM
jgi:hypothetical protein